MARVQARPGRRKIFFSSRVFAVLLTVVILIFGRYVWLVFQQSRLAVAGRDSVLAEIERLEERRRELEEKIVRLGTEQGIEAEIRERFLVAKAGEGLINVIIPPEESDADDTAVEPSGFWGRFWRGFRAWWPEF